MAPTMHIEKCGDRPKQLPRDKSLCNETVNLKAHAVQLAVLEILLLACANAHVICENNDFRRVAAFLSLHAQGLHLALGTEGARFKLRPHS
jgi:hypothetical protein